MDNKNKKVTIGDIFRVCFGRKLLLLIITAVTTILMLIFFIFFVNKGKEVYVLNYEYSINELNNGRYISGEKFDSRDILKEENIEFIKNSDADYATINIDDIIYNPNTSIRIVSERKRRDDGQTEIVNKYYSLTIPKSVFENSKQARKFMIDIVESPLKKNISIIENTNYSSNLNLFDHSKSYERQVDYLINQLNYLLTSYDSLLNTFGNYVLNDGTMIDSYKKTIEAAFSGKNDLDMLYSEIKINNYVKDETLIDLLESKLNILTKKRDLNISKQTELITQRNQMINSGSGVIDLDLESYNNAIITLSLEIKELDNEISMLEKQISSPVYSEEFDNKLLTYRTYLEDFTNDYAKVREEIVKSNSSVYFNDSSIIKTAGGINLIMACVMSIAVGLLLGIIVNICLDYKKLQVKDTKEEKEEIKGN